MTRERVLDIDVPIERFFEDISMIPRESGNEKEISDYLVEFAEERGLEWSRDEINNVIIRKGASPGYEDAPVTMLEAHTDMVCEKTPDCVHDFSRDPLELYVTDGILHAKGTSLGADDGWGVAYMLAILDDDELSHPALECVFTAMEEIGEIGAAKLDMSGLKSRILISLDGDAATETFVSCFTSKREDYTKDCRIAAAGAGMHAYRIGIGDMNTNVYHGIDHQEAGNAIKILARLFKGLEDEGTGLMVADLHGGTGEAAAVEKAEAVVLAEDGPEKIEKDIRALFANMNDEFDDDSFRGRLTFCELSGGEKPACAIDPADSRKLIDFVYLLPNNLFSRGIKSGELDCVNNIGHIDIEGGRVSINGASRSRYFSSEDQLLGHCGMLAEMYGFTFATSVRYRGWPYSSTSRIRELANDAVKKAYGRGLDEVICPGGLEIAHFVNGIRGIDAIELGVNHANPHSTDESMEMESFRTMYGVVTDMLANIR